MVALCKCLGKPAKAEKDVEAEAPKAEEIAEGVVADKKDVETKDGEEAAAEVKDVEVEEKKDDVEAAVEEPAAVEEAAVEEPAAVEEAAVVEE